MPTDLNGLFGRGHRLYSREGRLEYRFLWDSPDPRLPILRGGTLTLARWGNRLGKSVVLPRDGWVTQRDIDQGLWRNIPTVPVQIPATFARDGRGIWYVVYVGIRGLLVPDEDGKAVVYMITAPASDYYHTLTGSLRMPVFITNQF